MDGHAAKVARDDIEKNQVKQILVIKICFPTNIQMKIINSKINDLVLEKEQ